jgi:DNA-binding beta-propeller fold protein YncE
LSIGDEFAGLRIEGILGRGGMGAVYAVRDLALDAPRALKILEPGLARDQAFRDRFQRESRMAAAIDHPALVTVHRAGEEDGRLFIVMRLVNGPDLHRLVAKEGPLEPRRAAHVIAGMAGALDAAHARGIVHRDVKPANGLVEFVKDTGEERPFLTDFGIGRPTQATSPLTSTGELLGTAEYISPEQVEGSPADASSDIYALGCTAFFMLTGEAPFERDTQLATLYAHAHAERPCPSLLSDSVPEAVDEVVVRATAVDPSERYGNASEFAAEFSAAVGGQVPPRRPTTATRVLAEPPSWRRWPMAAAAAGLIALIAAAVLLASGDDDPASIAATPGADDFFVVDHPDSLVVGRVNVLVGSSDSDEVVAIHPRTGHDLRHDEVGRPTAVDVGFQSVWIADASAEEVLRFGPPKRSVPTEIPVGGAPADVAVGRRWVWVALAEGSVARIVPSRNQAVANHIVEGKPTAIAATENAAWAALPDSGQIVRIGRDGPFAPVNVGGRPVDLVAGDGSLWVLDQAGAQLLELNLEDGSELHEPIELGGSPRALDLGPGGVWVADEDADTLTLVDPNGVVHDPVDVGSRPVAVAGGDDAVWVANAGADSVTRVTP